MSKAAEYTVPRSMYRTVIWFTMFGTVPMQMAMELRIQPNQPLVYSVESG